MLWKLIQTLVKKGLEITIQSGPADFTGVIKRFDEWGITTYGTIEGFYKSSYIWLCEHDGAIHAVSRYGDDEGVITSMEDLASINFDWWNYSESKGWGDPESFWMPYFEQLGLVEVETKTKTVTTITKKG